MAVRENFQSALENLKLELLELGTLTKEAFHHSIEALKNQNLNQAQEIIKRDHVIDQLDAAINEKAILMIAKQQPVASDLRRIIVALKISTDIERMADLSVNIAKAVMRIGKSTTSKVDDRNDLYKMAHLASKMFSDAMEAMKDENVILAKRLAEVDDQVDALYGKYIQELIQRMSKIPNDMAKHAEYAFIARHLERFADHVTNIAENVCYLVKGKRYDLND